MFSRVKERRSTSVEDRDPETAHLMQGDEGPHAAFALHVERGGDGPRQREVLRMKHAEIERREVRRARHVDPTSAPVGREREGEEQSASGRDEFGVHGGSCSSFAREWQAGVAVKEKAPGKFPALRS